MTTDSSAPTVPAASAMGARPLLMEDIYKLIGALHLEIEVLRRQNAHLVEENATLSAQLAKEN
jgi:hypothetical protein